MKRLNILLISLCTLGFMASCSDDHDLTIAPDESFVSPELKAVFPNNQIFTETTDMNGNLGYVLWDAADYGYGTPVKYVLQADTAGGDFSKPIEVTSSNSTQAIITAKMLNDAGKNYTTKMEVVTLDLRLKTVITSIDFDAPMQKPLYSNIQEISFTPYITEIPMKAAFYLVGNALVGWGNEAGKIGEDLQPLFSANSDMKEKTYSYTGYFKSGPNPDNPTEGLGFKVIATPGVWDDAYGFVTSGASGSLAVNSNNYTPAASGYYTLSVDLSASTYTFGAYDASAAKKFMTIGLIGDATPGGWDTDTSMTLVAGQEHIWVITKVTLNAGKGMKFRAEKDWNKGGNWGTGTIPFGVATNDGGSSNIVIENGGDYFVAFNDLTGEYMIMPLKNAQKK